MKKLIIKEIIGDYFVLEDLKTLRESTLGFVWVDSFGKNLVHEGDIVVLNDELLDFYNPLYSLTYYIGEIDNLAGKNIVDSKSKDLIAFITKSGEFVYKRLFGQF